jgi:hypothetical protein
MAVATASPAIVTARCSQDSHNVSETSEDFHTRIIGGSPWYAQGYSGKKFSFRHACVTWA